MNLWQLFKKLYPVVRPYYVLVIATLILTLISSLTAQVNALTLQYAVDKNFPNKLKRHSFHRKYGVIAEWEQKHY